MRTPLPVIPTAKPFSLGTKFISLGSCFAQTMGNKLEGVGLTSYNNSFGTIFNPISLAQLLNGDAENLISENRYVERDGWWFHYNFPSALHATSKAELADLLYQSCQDWQHNLKQSDVLLLTLGTALGFYLLADNLPVANNHKQNANLFRKRMQSLPEIMEQLERAIGQVLEQNPQLKIIASVSPVRHTRQGLETNFVSKSLLRLAISYLQEVFPENVAYFPAFEILTDDLRDYRFYSEDMIHPSQVAEDYIWQHFQATYFDDKLRQFIRLAESRQKALAHIPQNKSGVEYLKWQAYIQQLDEQLLTFNKA